MPITVTWLQALHRICLRPLLHSHPDMICGRVPCLVGPRDARRRRVTPAPLPPFQKKKKSKPNPALRSREAKSCLVGDQVWAFKSHPKPFDLTLLPVCTVTLVLSLSFFWRGGQGVPASQLHIQVASNQEDKHRSVRLPLRGPGSLKPPQSERQVEKPRTGAQGHVFGLMGRAPPCPGGSAGHRLTSCSVMGADGGNGTELRGVNARLSSPLCADFARTL